MNARDYLAKRGIALDRDEDKPQTLGELAWSRAREAGSQRPRSGTPYDWEDWERYHGQLAEDADKLAQKIEPRDCQYEEGRRRDETHLPWHSHSQKD